MKTRTTLLGPFAVLWCMSYAQNPCLTGWNTFTTQAEIDNFKDNYPGCTMIEGGLVLADWETTDSIENLNGLNALTSVGWNLSIECLSLQDLSGLEQIIHIGEELEITNCFSLTNLSGLSNLSSIGSTLMISGNLHLESLAGLENLSAVGGAGIRIENNQELTSLEALENLASVGGGGISIHFNPALTSLKGLDQVDAESVLNLYITDNASLSECDVKSICDLLIDPNGINYIQNNASGCFDIDEVEDACGLGITDYRSMATFKIHPNPAVRGSITLTLFDHRNTCTLVCFDYFGQQVHQQEIRSTETEINVSTWSQGIYLAVVYKGGKPVGRSKFLVR